MCLWEENLCGSSMTSEAAAQERGHAKRIPSRLFNKGLPERCTLSTSAPVILLTTHAGTVSPVS